MKNNDTRNIYNLLKTKDIIAILDGDINYGKYEFSDESSVHIALPYLSGPAICSLSTLFGLPQMYSNLSRWQYFDNLLSYCIQENKCSDLLAHLFSKNQFMKVLVNKGADEIEAAHSIITDTIIKKISGFLYFGGHELVISGQQFIIKKIGSKVEIQAPKIKSIDREYIKSISARANQDIEQKNFDSAITKSRTLLEETFFYAIETKNEKPSDGGDVGKLFKKVRELYNMHTDRNADKRINTLLSGLNSIVSAIAEMRNKDSDAHGVGSSRINIDEHHARLFVNISISMADFILSIVQNSNNDK